MTILSICKNGDRLQKMFENYSFADLFRKYKVKAGLKTLSHLGEEFEKQGLLFENSIFSHWQRGSRIPTNRNTLLALIRIFIKRKAIKTITEINIFLESSGHGYLTRTEAGALFSSIKRYRREGFIGRPGIPLVNKTSHRLGRTAEEIFIENNLAIFNFDTPFTYTTGLKSPMFVDNRLLLSLTKERDFIINEMVKFIKRNVPIGEIDYVSSSFSFAAPFGVLVAAALKLPLILIRESKSSYGRFTKIEGHLPYGKRVLIVEDLISTGVAVIDNCETVRLAGGKTKYCVSLVDYEIKLVRKSMAAHNLKVFALTSGKRILIEAEKKGVLTKDEKKEVTDWLEAPFKWGKIRGCYKNESATDYYK